MKQHGQQNSETALSAEFIARSIELNKESVELTRMCLTLCEKRIREIEANTEVWKALSIRDFRMLTKMIHDLETDLRKYVVGSFPEAFPKQEATVSVEMKDLAYSSSSTNKAAVSPSSKATKRPPHR